LQPRALLGVRYRNRQVARPNLMIPKRQSGVEPCGPAKLRVVRSDAPVTGSGHRHIEKYVPVRDAVGLPAHDRTETFKDAGECPRGRRLTWIEGWIAPPCWILSANPPPLGERVAQFHKRRDRARVTGRDTSAALGAISVRRWIETSTVGEPPGLCGCGVQVIRISRLLRRPSSRNGRSGQSRVREERHRRRTPASPSPETVLDFQSGQILRTKSYPVSTKKTLPALY